MIKLASKSPSDNNDFKKPELDSTLVKPNPANVNKKLSNHNVQPKSAGTARSTLRLPAQAMQDKE